MSKKKKNVQRSAMAALPICNITNHKLFKKRALSQSGTKNLFE